MELKKFRKYLLPAIALALIVNANINNGRRINTTSSSFGSNEEAWHACQNDLIPTYKKLLRREGSKRINFKQTKPIQYHQLTCEQLSSGSYSLKKHLLVVNNWEEYRIKILQHIDYYSKPLDLSVCKSDQRCIDDLHNAWKRNKGIRRERLNYLRKLTYFDLANPKLKYDGYYAPRKKNTLTKEVKFIKNYFFVR